MLKPAGERAEAVSTDSMADTKGYLPIERHAVVGDRRTAALVGADGRINWWCLPNFDGETVFGSLLDAQRGGYWRLGPGQEQLGVQQYIDDAAVVRTSWATGDWELELTDAMLWPEREGSDLDPARSRPEYWKLIDRIADFTAANWQRKDNGIWELDELCHNVSSKVMSWVVLERACRIADKLGNVEAPAHWKVTMDQIHADVMQRGWSDSRQAFRQHYESDDLDASTLLLVTMGFLPPDPMPCSATWGSIRKRPTPQPVPRWETCR